MKHSGRNCLYEGQGGGWIVIVWWRKRFGGSGRGKNYFPENIGRAFGTGMRLQESETFLRPRWSARRLKKKNYLYTPPRRFGPVTVNRQNELKENMYAWSESLHFFFLPFSTDRRNPIVGFRRCHYNICNPFSISQCYRIYHTYIPGSLMFFTKTFH